MQRFIPFLLFVFILSSCNNQSSENSSKQFLGLQLKKGNTYHIKTKAQSTIKQTVNGREINTKMNISERDKWTITEVHDKFYTLKIEIKDFIMHMNTPRQNLTVNTEKAQEGLNTITGYMNEYVEKMTDKSFTIQLTKTGKVKNINGIKAIHDSISSSFDLPQKQRQKAFKQIQKILSKESLKQGIETFTYILPGKKVAVNDSWNNETTLQAAMVKGVSKNTLTLTDINSDTAYIKSKGNLNMNTSGMGFKNISTSTNMDGSTQSTYKIDPNTGMIKKATTKQEIGGNIVLDSPQLPKKKKIPMDVTTKINVVGSKDKDDLMPLSE